MEKRLYSEIESLLIAAALKGGPGSGYHGHSGGAGGPGNPGGSRPRGGSFTQGALFEREPQQRDIGTNAGTSSGFSEAISEGEITTSRRLGGGVTHSEVIEVEGPDGETYTAILKPMEASSGFHDGNSEVAAYRVAELMGIDRVPETVYADPYTRLGIDDDAVAQRFVEDARLYEWGDEIDNDALQDIAALDIVIYNVDRHDQNWVYDPEGKIWAIDHGHAVWEQFRYSNKAPLWNSELIGDGYKKESGTVTISFDRIRRWQKITHEEWDDAFDGVDLGGNVDPDSAWDNLQYIIEQGGRIRW